MVKVWFWARKKKKRELWSSLKTSYVAASEVVELEVRSSWPLEGARRCVLAILGLCVFNLKLVSFHVLLVCVVLCPGGCSL